MQTEKDLYYIDLFAGCGGLSLGLHHAGWKGLFAIEKSPFAFKTLEHNLINKKKHFSWPVWLPQQPHDINKILKYHSADLIKLRGTVDMITGGPPCQGFSTAGRRVESDNRNKLINSYIRFVELVQPTVLFFENVKGFTLEFDKNSTRGKKYSDYVINKLDGLDYDVHAELVNFSDYGIPQKRCRFILVGVKRNKNGNTPVKAESFFHKIKKNRQEFLVNKGLEISVSLESAISDLLFANGTRQLEIFKSFKFGKYSSPTNKYQEYLRKDIPIGNEIPDSHRFANHSPAIIDRLNLILGNAPKGKSLDKEFKKKYGLKKHTLIPLNGADQAPTITTLPDDYVHYCEPRILTVREYARLQSFPDSYEIQGKYTTGGKARVLEVPRYTQIGNAIPPLFGEQSGVVLRKILLG
ncbi:DNA cytosine methyltransferase [Mucilaginibacter limnophilus]|uniref:Cytosine-specific methyltransferase n=1 Tax=Mucilaginibacter limnophilus TaxID=1932778 RepID=A0A437MRL6_9SPHI|nr:DNA cytosine methyltransferase [Mucilaginibacter limnophilus]RVU00285.1 DNA cytosine methyltransferase [Mucilaginibacter limnophilus]